jgi:signal transduction histidine kinase
MRRLPDPVEILLFRIVQEIVNNAMRHSLAWNITLKMYWLDAQLKVEVKDDGVGKDKTAQDRSQKSRRSGGRGLPGMKKRAELIGAMISTEPVEKGTLFVVSYPFKK